MQIPYGPSSFDIVSIGYGLRNLESWERGLEEMVRVARPGGRLLVLDFGKPDGWLWQRLFFFYLRTVVPLLGSILCRDAAALAYIHESLQAYPAQRGVAEKMTALGCREVRVRNLLGGAMSIHSCVKRMDERGNQRGFLSFFFGARRGVHRAAKPARQSRNRSTRPPAPRSIPKNSSWYHSYTRGKVPP
jgi:SAM-dependent methyltransferase